MNLEQKIEAILFALGEPVTLHELIGLTKEDEGAVHDAVEALRASTANRGIILIETTSGYALGTHPDVTPILDSIRKEELGKELSKASLETLAIILYYNGAARSDIDFIRGVNSTFILRNLMMRGLIERKEHPEDSRKSFFVPTIDLQTHLGLAQLSDLPDFTEIHSMFVNRNATAQMIVAKETNDSETAA